jgi:hypothetical protein
VEVVAADVVAAVVDVAGAVVDKTLQNHINNS